jgi:hypothetical protein
MGHAREHGDVAAAARKDDRFGAQQPAPSTAELQTSAERPVALRIRAEMNQRVDRRLICVISAGCWRTMLKMPSLAVWHVDCGRVTGLGRVQGGSFTEA